MGVSVSLLAGSGTSATVDGQGAAAQFKLPRSVCVDRVGQYLYVCEETGHTIRKVEIATGVVTTLAGSGIAGSADGTGTAATFNGPSGICIDHTNTNLYVMDEVGGKIRKIVVSSGVVTTVASPGVSRSGLAIDPTDTYLYVNNFSNSVINKVTISDGTSIVLAGQFNVAGSADGTGTSATFNGNRELCIDSVGLNLYSADIGSNKIRKIAINSGAGNAGTVTTIAGSGTASSLDGIGTAATFNQPLGIAISWDDQYVFPVEYAGQRIRRIELSTGIVTTVSGLTAAYVEGSEVTARFSTPMGMQGYRDTYYLADEANKRIRRISITPTRFNNTGTRPAPWKPGSAR